MIGTICYIKLLKNVKRPSYAMSIIIMEPKRAEEMWFDRIFYFSTIQIRLIFPMGVFVMCVTIVMQIGNSVLRHFGVLASLPLKSDVREKNPDASRGDVKECWPLSLYCCRQNRNI